MPKPYDLTTHDGKQVDWLTHCALLEAEIRLGYRLTVVQGSYHKGVGASAGTHDGGGVVDLAPWDHVRKVRAAREVGFAGWHRTALPGVWNEHCHIVLIGNEKLSPAAANQILDYRNHRDGLAGHRADNTWHPDPIPTYKWPGSDGALALAKKAADLLDGKKPPPPPPNDWHPSTGPLEVDLIDLSHWNTATLAGIKTAMKAGVKGFYLKATEGTKYIDPTYAERRARVNTAGSTVGAYHYAKPKESDGTTQAKHFLAVAKPKRGVDFRIMLDLEPGDNNVNLSGLSRTQITTWVGQFVAEVHHQIGLNWHIIYTSVPLNSNFGWRLWVARYHDGNALPEIPAPWDRWLVRQFSNGSYGNPKSVPGFTKVDLNNVVGPVSALKMPAVKKPPPPPPPPPPPVGVSVPVGIVSANLRKDMSAAEWEKALRAVFAEHGDNALVGLQEVESDRNKAILQKVIVDEHGWAVVGLSHECPIYYNPAVWSLVKATVHEVPNSHRAFVSPTRVSTTAHFRHIETGALIGRLNNHRMNGVHTSDAPLSFIKWRTAAYDAHVALDKRLIANWSHTADGEEVQMFCTGDENIHDGSNPFGDDTELVVSHVSDYLAASKQTLTPHRQVDVRAKRTFVTGSDHLGLYAYARVYLLEETP